VVQSIKPELLANGANQIRVTDEEYSFFCNWCRHSRACCSPSLLEEHPDLRNIVCNGSQAGWARERCVRVLLGPLFPSMDSADTNAIDSIKTSLSTEKLLNKLNKEIHSDERENKDVNTISETDNVSSFKGRGNRFFKSGNYQEACDEFERGASCFKKIKNPTFEQVFDGAACSANAANSYLCIADASNLESVMKVMNMNAKEEASSAIKIIEKYELDGFTSTNSRNMMNDASNAAGGPACVASGVNLRKEQLSRLLQLKVKALFRRGKACFGYPECIEDLQLANDLAGGKDEKVKETLRNAEFLMQDIKDSMWRGNQQLQD